MDCLAGLDIAMLGRCSAGQLLARAQIAQVG